MLEAIAKWQKQMSEKHAAQKAKSVEQNVLQKKQHAEKAKVAHDKHEKIRSEALKKLLLMQLDNEEQQTDDWTLLI